MLNNHIQVCHASIRVYVYVYMCLCTLVRESDLTPPGAAYMGFCMASLLVSVEEAFPPEANRSAPRYMAF